MALHGRKKITVEYLTVPLRHFAVMPSINFSLHAYVQHSKVGVLKGRLSQISRVSSLPFRHAGIFAEKVLTEKNEGDPLRRLRATGIAARIQPACAGSPELRFIFRAARVVSSAGALHTPALLLRSNIRVNGNVGKNLRLHPATAVNGVFSKVYGCLASHA